MLICKRITMNNKKKYTHRILMSIIFGFFLVAMIGCKKYLSEKQDQKLVVPNNINDLQALLDDYLRLNQNFSGAGEVSSDDYYLLYTNYLQLTDYYRKMYTWEKENLFPPGTNNDWALLYKYVYIANVVLFNLDKVESNDQESLNNTEGCALFLRATSFQQAAWLWSLSYDELSASTDLGIPLRLDPNFNTPSERSNLKQTYDRIVSDLKRSAELLPETPVHVMRPSKSAAYGWLARTYLSMRQYDSAFVYSDKYLKSRNSLMDYNSITPLSIDPPFVSFNSEVIFHSTLNKPISTSRLKIDSVLYRSYDTNDLRKQVFFYNSGSDQFVFKGSYDGSNFSGNWFNGIATDEMYLTRAECFARLGNKDAALNDLNTLMVKRWKTGFFVPITATNNVDAINKVLNDRRKELIQRGLRWMDIKRLNKEGAGIKLVRQLNGQFFTLEPNDLRFALPIPEDVISLSGMTQNPR